MKKIVTIVSATLVGAALATTTFAATAKKEDTVKPVSMTKVSYIIGHEIGSGFKTQGVDLNSRAFKQGLNAGLKGKDAKYSKEVMQTTMQAFQKEMMEKAQAKQKEAGAMNLKKSDEYLAKVAKEDGVKELAKGIHYKVDVEGKGEMPTATDTVKVNYKGMLSDGKVFDSSYERKEPAVFGVSQVIPCWTKALEKMPVGSTWTVYCAADQAYGEYAPPSIGPNQALTFKVELLAIEKKADKVDVTAAKKVEKTVTKK